MVSLTQTKKKGKEGKEQLIKKLRHLTTEHHTLYVILPINLRSDKMKNIRQRFKQNSSIVFGKNKVMQIALGKDDETEIKPNLHLLAQEVQGQCGVLFTNESRDKIEEFFRTYRELEFPRVGFRATKTVSVPEGKTNFNHSLDPHLRKLGLPTQLKNGIIYVIKDYVICEEGQVLNPEQCKLLEFYGERMAEFRVVIKCVWHNGEFQTFETENAMNE